ncbi:hypothetical protein T439DRAFT_375767 [Meredithblackwellia eburnea MCA 4105]
MVRRRRRRATWLIWLAFSAQKTVTATDTTLGLAVVQQPSQSHQHQHQLNLHQHQHQHQHQPQPTSTSLTASHTKEQHIFKVVETIYHHPSPSPSPLTSHNPPSTTNHQKSPPEQSTVQLPSAHITTTLSKLTPLFHYLIHHPLRSLRFIVPYLLVHAYHLSLLLLTNLLAVLLTITRPLLLYPLWSLTYPARYTWSRFLDLTPLWLALAAAIASGASLGTIAALATRTHVRRLMFQFGLVGPASRNKKGKKKEPKDLWWNPDRDMAPPGARYERRTSSSSSTLHSHSPRPQTQTGRTPYPTIQGKGKGVGVQPPSSSSSSSSARRQYWLVDSPVGVPPRTTTPSIHFKRDLHLPSGRSRTTTTRKHSVPIFDPFSSSSPSPFGPSSLAPPKSILKGKGREMDDNSSPSVSPEGGGERVLRGDQEQGERNGEGEREREGEGEGESAFFSSPDSVERYLPLDASGKPEVPWYDVGSEGSGSGGGGTSGLVGDRKKNDNNNNNDGTKIGVTLSKSVRIVEDASDQSWTSSSAGAEGDEDTEGEGEGEGMGVGTGGGEGAAGGKGKAKARGNLRRSTAGLNATRS